MSLNVDKPHNVWYNNSVKEKEQRRNVMKNLERVIAEYKGKEFKVTNDKLNQVERNEFKSAIVDALASDLAEAGLDVGRVDGGVAFLVENDKLGAVTIVVDGVVKGLDYDFDFEMEDFAKAQAEKAERLAKRKAKAKA